MSKDKKTRILIVVLLTLAVLTLMIFSTIPDSPANKVSTPISVVLSPFESFFSGIGRTVGGFFKAVSENSELKKENERLRQENLDLRLQIKDNEQAALAYAELKKAFSLKDRFPVRRFIAANVLQEPVEPGFDYYRLDVGQSDGVDFKDETAYAVVDETASLAGRVVTSDYGTSKMLPVTYKGFSCSCRSEKDNENIFRLSGQGNEILLGEGIAPDCAVQPGDKIFTSGKGGIFPDGILCGKVISVSEPDSIGLRTCEIQVESMPAHKHVLFVLMPRTPEEAPAQTEETGS